MKKLVFLVCLVLFSAVSFAQLNPVIWNFTATKIKDKTYEIRLTANIQNGWHLYSQNQPKDAIAIPTTISINKNPLISLDGKIKELGKMEKFKDETLGVSAHQYSNKVDFVQVVKIKSKAKTNVTGTIEFQTCDDKKCLPPKTINFNLALK